MENNIFREYQFKFYLNGQHSVFFNGRQGEIHPHTWQFLVDILVQREQFAEYTVFEKAISNFLDIYQDKILNDLEPFDTVIPTLENIVDCFGQSISNIMKQMEALLVKIEGSETPTRSYIISYEQEDAYIENVEKFSKDSVSSILDYMLDSIIKKDNES